ncbi:acyl-CoA dehydrogenase family protein [Mumia sp. ZJ1417]|uniref:acyl-CoA dehydrogenase family protein n=1 Tax=Mumia sp. ZJ1417 TaxID=2708082 RepID=UPI001FB98002|nr:acyl-CoA dehydrogenase family protein [Mumia sp. ZJ1417]
MTAHSTRRDPMSKGLAVLNRIASLPVLDRLNLRGPSEQVVYHGARVGFRTAAAVSRGFTRAPGKGAPVRPTAAQGSGVFDLTPTEDQQMMVGLVDQFAREVVRPSVEKAEAANETPSDVTAHASELGLTLMGLPEDLGGLAAERSATTGALVAEALGKGDMGIGASLLAPGAVATAIGLWGDSAQQATYIPAFTGADVPAAALAVAEPCALFDPMTLRTTARKVPGGFVLDGVKSGVIRGAAAELFVVAARLDDGRHGLFVLESSTPGLVIETDPSMGLRAASLSRLVLDGVAVGPEALLAESVDGYADSVRLARIAWSGLALGTMRAVLDYVTPYVKERKAFGEPVAHRQGVAFMVADMAIELEGARLTTLRAASRADLGKPFAREAALSRRLCAEYGMKIGTDGVQLLGGHGFTKEHPVERWYRDLRAVGVMEGGLLV